MNTRRAKADAELARLGSAGVMRERFQRTLRSVAASSGLMTLRGIDTGRLTDEHYMKAAGIADREFKVDTDNVVSQFSSGMLDAFGRRIYQELFIAGGLSTQSRLIACDQWGVEMSLSLDTAKRALDQKTRDGRFITDGLPKGQNTERIIGDWGALGHAVGPIKPLLGAYLSLPQKEFKRRQAELESVRAMLSASPQALGVLTDLAECGLRAAPAERRALEAVASLLVFDASPLDADARSGMGAKACAFAGVSYDEARRRADEMKSAGNVVQSLKGVVKSVVVPPIESSLGRGSVEKIFDEVYGGPEAEGRLSEFEPTVRAREEMVAAHQKDMQRRGRRRSAPRLSNGAMREVVRAAASSSVEETTALLERVRAEAEAPKPKTNWGLGEGQYMDAFREARKAGITISEKRPKEGLWLSPDDLAYIQARRVAEGMTGVKLAYFVEELAKGRPNIVANVRARLERERELTPAEVEARREEFAKRFMEGFAPPKFAAIPEKSPTLAERDRDAAEAESQRQAAEVKRRERWGAARRKLEEAARGSGPGGRPIALGPPLVVEMAGGDLWAFAKEFFVGDPPTETAKKLESMPLSEMKQLCDEFQLDKPSLLITMWVMTREVGVDLTVGGIRDAVATLSKKVDRPIRVFATAADTPNNSVFAVGEYEYGAGKRPFGLFVNVDRMSEASDESIRKFAESYK